MLGERGENTHSFTGDTHRNSENCGTFGRNIRKKFIT